MAGLEMLRDRSRGMSPSGAALHASLREGMLVNYKCAKPVPKGMCDISRVDAEVDTPRVKPYSEYSVRVVSVQALATHALATHLDYTHCTY